MKYHKYCVVVQDKVESEKHSIEICNSDRELVKTLDYYIDNFIEYDENEDPVYSLKSINNALLEVCSYKFITIIATGTTDDDSIFLYEMSLLNHHIVKTLIKVYNEVTSTTH